MQSFYLTFTRPFSYSKKELMFLPFTFTVKELFVQHYCQTYGTG